MHKLNFKKFAIDFSSSSNMIKSYSNGIQFNFLTLISYKPELSWPLMEHGKGQNRRQLGRLVAMPTLMLETIYA